MTSEQIKDAIERLRGMKTSSRDFIVDVCRAFLGGEVTGDELHYTLIELLEQADPDAYMELPVGADGMPIHVGDLIYEEGGEPFLVDEMMVNKAKGWEIFGGGYGEGFSAYDPATCRHYHKPTVEDVLREFGDEVQRCCDTEDTIAEYAAKLREVITYE